MAVIIGTKQSSRGTARIYNKDVQFAFNRGGALNPPSGGFITHIGAFASGFSSPKLMWGIWERLPNGQPGQLLARTAPLTPPLVAAIVEGPLVWTHQGAAAPPTGVAKALRVEAGQPLILGFLGTSTSSGPAIELSAPGSTADSPRYAVANTTGVVSNPFGTPSSTVNDYRLGIYYLFEDSRAPTATITSPGVGTPALTDDTPLFTGTFSDPDRTAGWGDRLFAYELEVRREDTGEIIWSAANGAHFLRDSDDTETTWSREYTGPALPAGVTLGVRARVQDTTGEWSVFTAWTTFSIAIFGVVDTSVTATPTGKVDGDSAAISFSARWWNTGNLAATAYNIRILNAQGSQHRFAQGFISVPAASSAPGTLFTIPPDAEIGALAYGTEFSWQIRLKDTNNVWSGYSTAIAFRTNAVPTVPAPQEPANGATLTALPILRVVSSDADADDVPLSGVVWEFEITEVGTGTVRTVNANAYDNVADVASIQLTTTQIPAFGAYTWRARGKDLSAGAFGISSWSASRTFIYSDGPVVTISTPTEGEVRETTALRVQWMTSEAQTSYTVDLYNYANGQVGSIAWSSGTKLGTQQFQDVDPGVIQNNKGYVVRVVATNAASQAGTSLDRHFSVAFSGAEALTSLTSSIVARTGDVEPTTPTLQWSKSLYPTSQFKSYRVRRWLQSAGESSAVTLVTITNINQVTFADYHAPPNQMLIYAVSQTILAGSETLESGDIQAVLTYTLTTPMLVSIKSPATVRFPVKWLEDGYSGDVEPRLTEYTTWESNGLPTIVGQQGGPETRAVSFTIRSDDEGAMITKFLRIKEAVKAAHLVSFRDENERLFMVMRRLRWRRGRGLGTRTIQIDLRETSYRELA